MILHRIQLWSWYFHTEPWFKVNEHPITAGSLIVKSEENGFNAKENKVIYWNSNKSDMTFATDLKLDSRSLHTH